MSEDAVVGLFFIAANVFLWIFAGIYVAIVDRPPWFRWVLRVVRGRPTAEQLRDRTAEAERLRRQLRQAQLEADRFIAAQRDEYRNNPYR